MLLASELLGALQHILNVTLEAAGALLIEQTARLFQSTSSSGGIRGRLLRGCAAACRATHRVRRVAKPARCVLEGPLLALLRLRVA